MIITDEKRAALKEVYQLFRKRSKLTYGKIMEKYNLSSTEVESVRIGVYYKIKIDVLMSRISQIQEGMTSNVISIIMRG